MISDKGVCNQVKTNLVYYNLWTDVKCVEFEDDTINEKITVLHGKNPKVDENSGCTSGYDYVLPLFKQVKLTLQDLDLIFTHLNHIEGEKIGKLVMGIVDFDGTVVYYNVHSGVQKPKNA